MDKEQFNKLSLDDKGTLVFNEGKFLSTRKYYQQTIVLYSYNDFFIEVFYNSNINLIANIQIMKDNKTLDIYIDNEIN